MKHPVHALIESRVSVNYYDPERTLSDAVVKELVRLATLAPSAYNLQNWKLVAVRTPQARLRLKDLAFRQQKVADAPLTFIICGTLQAHRGLADALRPSVDAGVLQQPLVDTWVRSASQSHEGNPQLQRDEAMRSASLAAMTLMLAAEAMGLATCPMGGFDAAGVAREFKLDELDLPVMLVTVGYAAGENWASKPRKPLEQVLQFA